jgi:hypothetical protein
MDDEFGILESWNPVSLESRIPTSECLYYCMIECLAFQKKRFRVNGSVRLFCKDLF